MPPKAEMVCRFPRPIWFHHIDMPLQVLVIIVQPVGNENIVPGG